MQKVLEADNRISVIDALIITHALVDRDCAGLITLDSDMLNSKGLRKLAKEYGKKLREPEYLGCEKD